MAHFRGVVAGSRGKASRLGTKASGLQTVAQAWSGQVVVQLWESCGGEDCVTIEVEANGGGSPHCLFFGTMAELRQKGVL